MLCCGKGQDTDMVDLIIYSVPNMLHAQHHVGKRQNNLLGYVGCVIQHQGLNKDMINCFILIIKQCIYSEKCLQNQLKFVNMLDRIYNIINIEHIIAVKQRIYYKF